MPKKKWKKPRPLSIVRFRHEQHTDESNKKYYKGLIGKHFLFMGEIPNQIGHCILWTVGPRDKNFVGEPEFFRHTEDFEEVHEDDL